MLIYPKNNEGCMLDFLYNIVSAESQKINQWFKDKIGNRIMLPYSSVDIRFSGNKLAPIDTNLFPAGFNNLNEEQFNLAKNIFANYIKTYYPKAKKILLVGENHTRNENYQENISIISRIIESSNIKCQTLSLDSLNNSIEADLIFLNNDLMAGFPLALENIKQPIIPNPLNGWFKRRKSNHFAVYNSLAQEFEREFNFPHELITTKFEVCKNINFKEKIGLEDLLSKTQNLFENLNNQEDPFIVIKSDYGTYGMGVTAIRSIEEIENINKKMRKQMHITKGNVINQQVILQEGVKTIEIINGETAEPLLYLINNEIVSFFYRTHLEKDKYSNLNSVGMKIINNAKIEHKYKICCHFIARLSTLAALYETEFSNEN